jgi:hypothetical protein
MSREKSSSGVHDVELTIVLIFPSTIDDLTSSLSGSERMKSRRFWWSRIGWR